MLFVSHDLAAVEALCDRVLVLHHGTMRHDGDKKTGIAIYYALGGAAAVADQSAANASVAGPVSSQRELLEPPEEIEPLPALPDLSPTDASQRPWQMPDLKDSYGNGAAEVTGVCFARSDGSPEPVVEQGQWLQVFLRVRAVTAAPAANIGLAIYDRHNRLLFARGLLNAELEPIDLDAGQEVVARLAIKLDLEPSEYIVALSVSQALPDAASPTGWNQHVGGERYHELPRGTKIAVLPAANQVRKSFGPANLRSRIEGIILHAPTPMNPTTAS
jgi:lipopolysaccharide transport system ATP-binding protein